MAHVHMRLHGGFVTASRLVARLHALAVDVAELHVNGDQLCVQLDNAGDVRRVRTVLDRCADVSAGAADGEAACRPGPVAANAPTTYVVWSEPLGVQPVKPASTPQVRSRASRSPKTTALKSVTPASA